MTTFTIYIENQDSEKVVRAFLDTLKLEYRVENNDSGEMKVRPLNKKENQVYESLKGSLTDIEKWKRGELELKSAKDLLNEL